ncbi:hypothetical protein [Chitinophaga sp. 212800010-3]|uniref:hypothetical protein n=1 Tax=unclassified Chitinophaga TaxID=2619133 RepID=UPI002DEC0E8B|nr:hypothetical protein [Chitinophaga sp. 212800010-3]
MKIYLLLIVVFSSLIFACKKDKDSLIVYTGTMSYNLSGKEFNFYNAYQKTPVETLKMKDAKTKKFVYRIYAKSLDDRDGIAVKIDTDSLLLNTPYKVDTKEFLYVRNGVSITGAQPDLTVVITKYDKSTIDGTISGKISTRDSADAWSDAILSNGIFSMRVFYIYI